MFSVIQANKLNIYTGFLFIFFYVLLKRFNTIVSIIVILSIYYLGSYIQQKAFAQNPPLFNGLTSLWN